jgi:restriction system protein
MALFLVRGGADGEDEQHFLSTGRICLPLDDIHADLSFARNFEDIQRTMLAMYPGEPPFGNWAGQVFAFVVSMQPGDRIILPRKGRNTMAVGEVASPYEYCRDGPCRHSRRVRWIAADVPRSVLEQNLDSIGAGMAVCPVSRYDAEERIHSITASAADPDAATTVPQDAALSARESITAAVRRRFSGPRLAVLVKSLLHAQGYDTRDAAGSCGGAVTVLAVPRRIGGCEPTVCAAVATDDRPLGISTVYAVSAMMQNMHAGRGLLVSWSGTDAAVENAGAEFVLRIRSWGEREIVDALLEHYDRLDAAVRDEVPLTRIWILTLPART